ncbi:T9SS type A sorting domain-containing protein, partial [uncultured Maribacter sp.]|uniref:T9SS type A sorting domain-containing protein n=1 Tax=uncultured Maribacter sp. TaxID=431308 RepID=UPI0030EE3630
TGSISTISFTISNVPLVPLKARIIWVVVEVYPNPATTFVNIVLKGGINTRLESIVIYDIAGRLIRKNHVNELNQVGDGYQLDVSTMAPGIYMVNVNNNTNMSYMEKIIIE